MNNKLVKVISANELVFPQTVVEAILINDGAVVTLDKVLNKKVENIIAPAESGLVSIKLGTSVLLNHTNVIIANESIEARLIKYDTHGHITSSEPFKKLTILVNKLVYSLYDGNKDTVIEFGDDFKKDDNNNISLTWGNK